MKVIWFLSLIGLVSCENIFFSFFKNLKPIKTVNEIDLEKYVGKWYQAGTSKSTKLLGTGINFRNVTAIYECIETCSSNNITVLNEGFNEKNDYVNITGISYSLNKKIPSNRKVEFVGVPVIGNYWIIKLGPIKNDKYEYAIVSGPISKYFGTRFSLYVLCRNKEYFYENYEQEVKEWCNKNGFVFSWNKYIKTY